MTIKQLLAMPIGEKVGGFELSIKTFKKNFQVGKVWFQQVILMDTTGEMPADVNIGTKYNPIRGRASSIRIVVCEVQEAEYLGKDRKKLLVHECTFPTTTMAEWEEEQEAIEAKWNKEIEGKIRHGLVCSFVKAGKEIDKPAIEALVKYITTGE
jgi:hypothetical protein